MTDQNLTPEAVERLRQMRGLRVERDGRRSQ